MSSVFNISSNSVYGKVLKCFPDGRRSVKSIESAYDRSLRTFKLITAFESNTGNGGGDPDVTIEDELNDPESQELDEEEEAMDPDANAPADDEDGARDSLKTLEKKIELARVAGKNVGKLSARTADMWYRTGLYDIFYARYVRAFSTKHLTKLRLLGFTRIRRSIQSTFCARTLDPTRRITYPMKARLH